MRGKKRGKLLTNKRTIAIIIKRQIAQNRKNDPLAQLAEQLPFKQWVRSSNLRRVTKNRKGTGKVPFLFFAPSGVRTAAKRSKKTSEGGRAALVGPTGKDKCVGSSQNAAIF